MQPRSSVSVPHAVAGISATSSEAGDKRASRYRELDALRGLAALAVVLFHYTVRYFELFPGVPPGLQFSYGSLGVEVFFGISGFVILMTLERSKSASDFLVSRFSRLYPAYWTCLIVTYLVTLAWPLPGRVVTPVEAVVNLSMWQEVLHFPHVDGVYWSLQVELIFYALMLATYTAGLLRHVRVLLVVWLLVALAVLSLSHWLGRPVPYLAERFLLLQFCAFFAIGASAYLAFKIQRIEPWNWVVFALAVLVAGSFHGKAGWIVASGMVTLFVLIARRKAGFLDNPVLVYLGTISYTLYLLHQNIGYVIIRAAQSAGLSIEMGIGLAIVASMTLATGVTYAVEKPSLKWIRKRLRSS